MSAGAAYYSVDMSPLKHSLEHSYYPSHRTVFSRAAKQPRCSASSGLRFGFSLRPAWMVWCSARVWWSSMTQTTSIVVVVGDDERTEPCIRYTTGQFGNGPPRHQVRRVVTVLWVRYQIVGSASLGHVPLIADRSINFPLTGFIFSADPVQWTRSNSSCKSACRLWVYCQSPTIQFENRLWSRFRIPQRYGRFCERATRRWLTEW